MGRKRALIGIKQYAYWFVIKFGRRASMKRIRRTSYMDGNNKQM
jgi:hypothetical protein